MHPGSTLSDRGAAMNSITEEISVTLKWRPALAAGAVLLSACAAVSHAQPVPGAAAPSAPHMAVRDFMIEGNTLLPQADLDAVLESFKGERTVDELRQAAMAVQESYARAGYGAVVAFVPQQSPANGVVTLRVVEGKLAQVAVTGQQQFSEDNVRASLPALETGTTPNLKRIDAQIQIANENPSKKVQVLLQPGQRSGEAQARVSVTERPVQQGLVALDNTGNSNTGRLRASLGWQHANVAGRDHVLSAQFMFSPDEPRSVRVLSAAYRVPFYAQQMVVDAYAAWSDVDGGVTATVAGDLQFTGEGRLFGVRAGRYLARMGEWDQRVSLGLDQRDYRNSCEIAGLPPGACGPAGESVSVQPLWAEYTVQRSLPLPFGASVSLHHNLQLGGGHADDERFEAVRPGAKPRYTSVRLAAFGALPVGESWQLQGRANVQLTDDALVPSEQFGIGGAATVRGYSERELAGDRGASASLELVGPDLAEDLGMAGSLRLSAFADAGAVHNRLDTPCRDTRSRCSIASMGAGARLTAGRFGARLHVAQALKDAVRTERSDIRGHFSLSYAY